LEREGYIGWLARAARRVSTRSCSGLLGRHEADWRARPFVYEPRPRRRMD